MRRADPERPGHPAAATAGTLDTGAPDSGVPEPGAGAAEVTGQAAGQAGSDPAGQAAARPSQSPAAVPPSGPGPAGPGRVRGALRKPVVQHLGILICFIAAGVAATWPLAANLTGRIPANRDPASYVWDFWWVAHQVTHLGNPWFTPLMAAPPGVLFTPVTLAFGPAFSYNLWTVILPGLLCYAMYRAARLWLRSATGAIG